MENIEVIRTRLREHKPLLAEKFKVIDTVWQTLQEDIPPLKDMIQEIIEKQG